MKKIALTSLLSVFAVSGAYAANTIDGNPLYMPKAGHFYSETALSSHSEATKDWALGEDFGFGITDKLAVNVKTGLAEGAEDFTGGDDEMFDTYGWTHLGVNATFRAFQDGNIVADVYGGVEAGGNPAAWMLPGGGLFYHSDAADDSWWFDKDLTGYTWTAGVRGGYVSSLFTVAGHFEYSYMNSEMFNWGDAGLHMMSLGLDGQFVIDPSWNLVAGVEYTGITNDHLAYDDLESPADNENSGVWTGYFGVNYNIDATKYVGAYVNGTMNHHGGDAADEWEIEDGFGFGVKFGIDF